ncbi:lanthionine synthetase LanC family protein [Bacillus thuringiensis]|uniref:lanthionine synthetase LanC family protein n=1 Tax=Bacillus thuringiensis TaxID=1428 RepID=UPI001876EA90|nr:lanthionine synthetase LanC family protein [Bacillus thuringiensis]MBE5096794.1 hypothetical protein [Bacillus thuringiensis]
MNQYIEQVKEVVRAINIHSPTTYSWLGKRSMKLSPTLKRSLTPENTYHYLLYNLQSKLYSDFYCKGVLEPANKEFFGQSISDITFIQELSDANTGCGYLEKGWTVNAVSEDKVIVCRGDLQLWVDPGYCGITEENSISPGMQQSLRFPKEFPSISPGFYMALSDQEFSSEDSQNLVRIYFNINPSGAVHLMRMATSMLNGENIPFKLKVLNNPARFTRCDSMVLYINKNDYEAVSEILKRIYPDIISSLRKQTPVFTKVLAPGMGAAEDPGQGESFGSHRCRILADGLIQAYEQGRKSIDEKLQVIVERFVEEKLCLEKPYLNPFSIERYHFQPESKKQAFFSYDREKVSDSSSNKEAFLWAAETIGHRLTKEAIWHEDRCTWLGVKQLESSLDGQIEVVSMPLGPEFYSGTSGVALFLAELYSVTGDEKIRRTALGALRQAMVRANGMQLHDRLGFYTGWMGITFALVKVGMLLGENSCLDQAKQLLRKLVQNYKNDDQYDLLSGKAGAIIASLALKKILEDSYLTDFAELLGDELVTAAEESEYGFSWKMALFPKQCNLTGFSHGTAGIGYALLELFHLTNDSKYRKTAEAAFDYERYWFDSHSRNWPDLRELPNNRKRLKQTLSFSTTWCHGAPGIALSRLRAYEITKDETYRDEATIALQTTSEMIESWLQAGTGNFSLCHGLSGNTDVLLYGNKILGPKWSDVDTLARHVGQLGIEKYAKPGLPWPCGTVAGETPNLMLGLAGIGYFYLRLYHPETPSVLIL